MSKTIFKQKKCIRDGGLLPQMVSVTTVELASGPYFWNSRITSRSKLILGTPKTSK